MSKALLYFLITIIILGLAVIVLAATVADVGAADECHHGCPPVRTVQVWLPVVAQCSGQYCGLFTAEPEPGR